MDVIIDEESGWNPYVGLMQLMPQTAVRFGIRNRFRIDENIRGGVAYLASLNHEFPGPSEKAGIIFGRCAGICEPSGQEVPGPARTEGNVRADGAKYPSGGSS